MAGFLIALVLMAGIIGVCGLAYKVAMDRNNEILEVLEPDEPEPDEPEVPYGDPLDDEPLPDIGSSSATPSGRSTAERLAELDDLLGRGLITPAEHHEQRSTILRSI